MKLEDLSTERLLLLATGTRMSTADEYDLFRRWTQSGVREAACRILAARMDALFARINKLGGAS